MCSEVKEDCVGVSIVSSLRRVVVGEKKEDLVSQKIQIIYQVSDSHIETIKFVLGWGSTSGGM